MNDSKIEAMIKRAAIVAHRKLPAYSKYVHSVEDLVQEGRLVDYLCRGNYDKSRGVQYHNFLLTCLICRYSCIIRSEQWGKRKRHELDGDSYDYVIANVVASTFPDPESMCLFGEILTALGEVSKELQSLFLDGVPEGLLRAAKVAMRRKNFNHNRRGTTVDKRVIFSPRLVEFFYGISIKKVAQKLQKRL
jgi:hypothetical protein